MTIDTFLARLSETPRAWRIEPNGYIRLGDPTNDNPGGYVDPHGAIFSWPGAERLSEDDAFAVFKASDNEPGHDPVLRGRILTACGLTDGT